MKYCYYLWLALFAFPVLSNEEKDTAIFSIVYENDIFANTDNGYTNGVRFGWLSSESNSPNWLKWSTDTLLPFATEGKKHLSIAVGQNMYTPTNLSVSTPLLTDRPYAGWLYASIGVISQTENTLDNLMLTFGMVGPASFAEETQKFIHQNITHSEISQGWDNQLKNEPGIILTYQRKWKALYEISKFGLGMDIVPQAGFNLGNVETDVMTGGTIRLGYNLHSDYGPPRVRPSLPGSDFFIPNNALSAYLFAGIEVRAVARNIFLDGNSFVNSQNVDRNILVGNMQFGASAIYGNNRISYTNVFMTREFREQKTPEAFGVVTFSYGF
jgi:lipid A 3-O-deacylase